MNSATPVSKLYNTSADDIKVFLVIWSMILDYRSIHVGKLSEKGMLCIRLYIKTKPGKNYRCPALLNTQTETDLPTNGYGRVGCWIVIYISVLYDEDFYIREY
jgi:hypothetical protein